MSFGLASTLELTKTGVYGSLCFRKRYGKWTLTAQVWTRNTKVFGNGEKIVAGAIKSCARRCTYTKRELYLRKKNV